MTDGPRGEPARDGVTGTVRAAGQEPEVHVAGRVEYLLRLGAKPHEEADEVAAAACPQEAPEESADLPEALRAPAAASPGASSGRVTVTATDASRAPASEGPGSRALSELWLAGSCDRRLASPRPGPPCRR